jgi:hypothetical protein
MNAAFGRRADFFFAPLALFALFALRVLFALFLAVFALFALLAIESPWKRRRIDAAPAFSRDCADGNTAAAP